MLSFNCIKLQLIWFDLENPDFQQIEIFNLLIPYRVMAKNASALDINL